MLKIQSLLHSFYKNIKSISKKCYTNSLIITTGTVVVAVISLNSNTFDGAGKNKVIAQQHVFSGGEVKAQEEVDLEAKLQEAQEVFNTEEMLMGEVVSEPAEEDASDALVETNQANLVTQSNHIEEINPKFNIELSQADLEALQRIVEAEATGEGLRGKVLVANVVLNRVLSDEFADSVYDVVFEKIGGQTQFSPVSDGRYYSVKVTDETREAVGMALSGVDYSQGALYFVARVYADSSNLSWFDRKLTKLFQYGVHEFYTY